MADEMSATPARPRPTRRRSEGRPASVTDDAIAKIQQMIVTGRWKPGDRLPRESELAAQLGLSRNSLREAVRALSLIRVLEVRQGDGTYVSSLEPHLLLEPTRFLAHLLGDQTALDLFEARRLLEPAATALAAVRIGKPGLALLQRYMEQMIAAGTVEQLVEADIAFHAVIAEATDNAVVVSLLDSLSGETLRARLWRGIMDGDALDVTRAEHAAIYDAVAAGDPDLARAAATVHIASGERWLRQHLGSASAPGALRTESRGGKGSPA